jgi:O-succinylbenzoic acid--CoA ligase
MNPYLYLHQSGQLCAMHQLIDWVDGGRAQPASENEENALRFCYDWLRGRPAFVVQTSGSTGAAKPISVTRQQMEASARATGAALGLQPGMYALVCLPTRYIAGRMMLVRGLVLGLHLTVVEPASNPLAHLPPDQSFDFTAFTPMQMQVIIESGEWRPESGGYSPQQPAAVGRRSSITTLNHMHAILLGGGPVSAGLEEQVQVIAAPVFHTYGMTETVSHIALRRLNGAMRAAHFVPLPGVQLGLDERGCLSICAEVTNGQRLQTNDLVDLHADGSFVWLGRWDNVINSGGVKVVVEKVEAAIEQAIQQATGSAGQRFFVAARPDPRLGERVALLVEGPPLTPPQESALQAHLRHQLNPYERPRQIEYLPTFVNTPTGKIDRKATLLVPVGRSQ